MEEGPPERLDDVLADLPHFAWVKRPANTYEERDDPATIYGARTIADLSREVLKRLAAHEPTKPHAGRATGRRR